MRKEGDVILLLIFQLSESQIMGIKGLNRLIILIDTIINNAMKKISVKSGNRIKSVILTEERKWTRFIVRLPIV